MEVEKYLVIDGSKEEPGRMERTEEMQQLRVEEKRQIVETGMSRLLRMMEEMGGTVVKEDWRKEWSVEGESMSGKDRSPLKEMMVTRSTGSEERGPNKRTESPGTVKQRGRSTSRGGKGNRRNEKR
ncbi:hypothetical protein CgunFtcFv8_018846 [Champsocephalus gunnari]|uniref:Uncharacterized protein n=1 Tax=Champsocephalus gunnari TaxID=52237 RepID=A0AAN8BWW1_CHAGU|nr:hypothetical protein CgunFtcFv8_018846 [Champsocephalus gunnari]